MSCEKNLKKSNKRTARDVLIGIGYQFVKFTGAPSAFLWFRPRRLYPYGRKRVKGGVLISSNHRTFLDPIIVHLTFPGRTLYSLATKDLYTSKLRTFFFNMAQCIVVDKDNFSLSSFHTVVNKLKAGKAVVIFPEGQVNRNENDTMLAFKSGAALMAFKSNAPILPMYIVKQEKWWHRQTVVVGEVFYVSELAGKMPTMNDLTRVSDHLREEEIRLREYYEAWHADRRNKKKQTETNKEKQGEKHEHQYL